MPNLSHRVQQWAGLEGWRRNGLLFITGGLSALLFAPFHAFPLLFVLLPVFFLVLDQSRTLRRAAWDGFFFGYGYFMAGTYWIAIALTVDATKFGWMIPLSLFGLSAVFALYFALFGFLYHRFKFTHPLANLLWFAVLWVLIEYLRSYGIFGFPWNLIGYSLVPVPPLLQSASIVGIYGLSLLAVLIGLMPLSFLATSMRRARSLGYATLALCGVLAAYGIYYQQSPSELASDPVRLRLVQANIPQRLKWEADELQRIIYTQKILTQLESDAPPPDIVIWPETAVPLLLTDDHAWLKDLAAFIPPQSHLITGIVREKNDKIYNSVILLASDGTIADEYYKRQLVPFGEFIPLRNLLPLDRIAPGPRDFSAGEAARTLMADKVPAVQPMVCYESIFPRLAQSENLRARWLLTITNDAWFGNSPGPYQHFDMGRVRAVEQGLPLIRVANTGISGVIDVHGHVLRRLELGKQGVLDVVLPPAKKSTFYARNGESMLFLCLLTLYLFAVVYARSTKGGIRDFPLPWTRI